MPWSMADAPARASTPVGSVTSRSAGTTLWVAYEPGTPVQATRSPAWTVVTPCAHRLDDTRALEPEGTGQRVLVETRALVDVDEVDPGGLDPDEGLTVAGLRGRQLLELHGLRAAVLVNADRTHAGTLP